ncbi:MAG TPA: M15 family metallopeptidase [Nocardioidaceae bacterium]|nr:M15 family metallopeptidase [Nocardioidaceae bacterium]
MVRRLLVVAVGTTVLAACGTSVSLSGGEPATTAGASPSAPARATRTDRPPPVTVTPRPTTRTTAPTSAPATAAPRQPARSPRRAPRLDSWQVGANPLPLRPDGFGEVQRTPRELRVRRMPTVDLLPPPRGGRFESSVAPISQRVRRRMGETWTPRCPVALDDLRYLTVSFWGFDDRAHTGELVVHADVARDVVGVFRRLYRERYPIEEMRLVTTADLDAPPTGDGNNTAALVCRPVRGQSEWSAHAYGQAIDVNPFLNPYRNDDLVLPELASAYLDRGWRRPGMVHPDGVVVRAFESIGWTWGGDFESLEDYMHFSATGG